MCRSLLIRKYNKAILILGKTQAHYKRIVYFYYTRLVI